MKKSTVAFLGTALLGASIALWGTTARAQEHYLKQPLPAPQNAFELQVSTGYSQGFGKVFTNTPVNSVAGAGMGFTGDLGYRISPLASLEWEGQYQVFAAENGSSSQGFAANIGTTLHARPESRGDPWLRLAMGWRFLWQSSPTIPVGFGSVHATNSFSGWDLLNARIGVDIRSSGNVAWAPFFGANLQIFSWQNTSLQTPVQVATFLYAGLQARFDVGGSTTPSGVTTAKR